MGLLGNGAEARPLFDENNGRTKVGDYFSVIKQIAGKFSFFFTNRLQFYRIYW
jgi:hypothetical protein